MVIDKKLVIQWVKLEGESNSWFSAAEVAMEGIYRSSCVYH